MNDSNAEDNVQPVEDQLVSNADFSRSTASFPGLIEGESENIGPYKLLGVLGEGGFAVVYLAEQRQPVKRRVALKLIKPGMDTKQVIARFEAERQALAFLDHPSIAQIYDAGKTKAGRPYFVMEHIEGVQITQHCDEQKLSIEKRLQLFMQVCDGIEHAHQKGIIHRDLKPSNVLVVIAGKKAVVKIIDFGIAKALTQSLTEQTLFTEQGQLIGTPEYMSPEQAAMTNQGIDTRSDIYSLGVLLYELLTGALPFTRKTLEQAGFAEIQKIIREVDPPHPSTRLSSLGDEAERVASTRGIEVHALVKRLRKELEWIPLKAMRKERSNRYRSTSELSDDIQNYLKGAPLIAGPESAAYRFRKFVRRNRSSVVGAFAVLLLFVLVNISMFLALGRARARAEAEQQKEVVQAMDAFFDEWALLLADPNTLPEDTSLLGDLSGVKAARLRDLQGEFGQKPLIEASIRNRFGEILLNLNQYDRALLHLERAFQIRYDELGEENPSTLMTIAALARLYSSRNSSKKAAQMISKLHMAMRHVIREGDALITHRLARSFHDREAEEFYLATLDLVGRLPTSPVPSEDDVFSIFLSAIMEQDLKDPAMAICLGSKNVDLNRFFMMMLASIGMSTRDFSFQKLASESIKGDLALLYIDWGKPDQAESWYHQITHVQKIVVPRDPPLDSVFQN